MRKNCQTVAIVVTYNRREKLLACLGALQSQTAACDVMIVDNDSTDGTAAAVDPLLRGGVFLINTGGNLGGAGGFAFGIAEALRRGYEYLWLMDDDVIASSDALAELFKVDRALGGGYGWLSSKCTMPSGGLCPMNLQRATPYKEVPVASFDAGAPVPAQMATFVSLFFRAGTARRFGLPIAEFFIWCDDLEWTRRVSHATDCFIAPKSSVVHEITGSAASDVAVDSADRIPRYFYAFRNELFVYRREGMRGIAYYAAKTVKNLIRIVFCARNRRLARMKALFSGVTAGLGFHPVPAAADPAG